MASKTWRLAPTVVFLLVHLSPSLCATSPAYAPTIHLTSGPVRGLIIESEPGNAPLHHYRGIRFGTAARFAKPKPAPAWAPAVYDATVDREACTQLRIFPSGLDIIQTENTTEDCLTLNIWRPAGEAPGGKNRSVLVFLHGGAFMIGSIYAKYFDAKYLASRGELIVVTLSYRLGPFGFLYGGDIPPNLGLHDQILGLTWVRDNIAAFGGDPNSVTLAGSSAGSVSTAIHMLSPKSAGLFHRAILLSGAPNSELTISPKQALALTREYALQLNCHIENIYETIVCLRSKTASEMVTRLSLDWAKNEIFWPVYGDELLPLSPVEALNQGKVNPNIDLIYGFGDREGSSFAASIFPKLKDNSVQLTVNSTRDDIVYLMKNVYKKDFGEQVAKMYLKGMVNPTQDQLKIALSAAYGDYFLICPTVLFGQGMATASPTPRYYSYRLVQRLASSYGGAIDPSWMGVTHGQDWLELFDVYGATNADDKKLSKDLARAMAAFAKTGDPGTVGSAKWEEAFPRGNGGQDSHKVTRHLALNVKRYQMVSGAYTKNCDAFWKEKITQL